MLRGRRLVLGVSGGIAAYKAADLTSRLVQGGADVYVVMTRAATGFVAPLTFEALSGRRPLVDVLGQQRLGHVEHVEVARLAEACVVAPATANLIGKLSAGIADDALTTVLLGTHAPLLLAPAMEAGMYESAAVQANLRLLAQRGARLLEPGEGRLASGRSGRGRMAEPAEIIEALAALLGEERSLEGARLLVTAGPTREHADPVRYLSNPSSGRMGFAVAAEAARRGGEVLLVAGPTELPTPPGVRRRDVTTAEEMKQAVDEGFDAGVDVVVKAAAVADYRPREQLAQKRRKSGDPWRLELEPTADILAGLGARKRGEVLVGFAAETDGGAASARSKVDAKHLDLIVLNEVGRPDAGFASETNRVRLVWADGREQELPLLAKREVAGRLLDAVGELLERAGDA